MVVKKIDEEFLEFDIKIFVKEKVIDFADLLQRNKLLIFKIMNKI